MTESLFFELLKVATGNQEHLTSAPSARQWVELYEMAKKQSLIGITFSAVEKLYLQDGPTLNIPEQLYYSWMASSYKIQDQNELLNKRCVELCEKLQKEDFRTCILKGQGTAKLYGHLQDLRSVGDIDVWVMPKGIRTIKASRPIINRYVHALFPEEKGAFVHIGFPIFEDVEVEMHYIPTMGGSFSKDKQFEKLFEECQDACFNNKTESGFAVPESALNVLFNLQHIQRHFISEGIGLRHVLDFYYVLKFTAENHQAEHSLKLISEFGTTRFFSALMWVIEEVIEGGSSTLSQQLGVKSDSRLGRVLLREMMRGGNFGHHDDRLQGISNSSFRERWHTYLRVSKVRFRYFPKETFNSWIFRLRVGFWRRTGIEV